MKPICIIPARAGSVRTPDKNGTPLVHGTRISLVIWSVIQALASDLFSQIVVSTNDDAIMEAVSRYRVQLGERGWSVQIHSRKPDLCTKSAEMIDVVQFHADEHHAATGESRVQVVLFQPTSPFRTLETVQNGIAALDRHDRNGFPRMVATTQPLNSDFLLYNGCVDAEEECTKPAIRTGNTYCYNFIYRGVYKEPHRWVYLEVDDCWQSLDVDYPRQWEMASALLSFGLLQLFGVRSGFHPSCEAHSPYARYLGLRPCDRPLTSCFGCDLSPLWKELEPQW